MYSAIKRKTEIKNIKILFEDLLNKHEGSRIEARKFSEGQRQQVLVSLQSISGVVIKPTQKQRGGIICRYVTC